MGSRWLRDILRKHDRVNYVECDDKNICEIDFITSDGAAASICVYMPNHYEAGEDYLIDQDVVARAIKQDATHIVYEKWIVGPTLAAREYARDNSIKIYPLSDFLRELSRGTLYRE